MNRLLLAFKHKKETRLCFL